jgi:hypothetical protein
MKRDIIVEYRNQSDELIDHSKLFETEIPKLWQVVRPFRTMHGQVRWYVTRVLVFKTDWDAISHVEVMVEDLGYQTDYDFRDYEEFDTSRH